MQFKTVLRANAAQATIDRFFGKPFIWGTNDCVQMAAFIVRQLGHPDPLAGVKPYATMRNARKAMKAAGVEAFDAYLDNRFQRQGYASALPGDIIGVPGQFQEDGEVSVQLGVAIGQGRVLVFGDPDGNGHVCGYHNVNIATHCWRVPVLAPFVDEIVQADEIFADHDAQIEAASLADGEGN